MGKGAKASFHAKIMRCAYVKVEVLRGGSNLDNMLGIQLTNQALGWETLSPKQGPSLDICQSLGQAQVELLLAAQDTSSVPEMIKLFWLILHMIASIKTGAPL